MPCPHYDIRIVKRSMRQSAVAAAAYQAGDTLFSEYDQKRKNYSGKKEVIYEEILLPGNAPKEYADRETLWNAVEAEENQWNSQLARRIIMAIPKELSHEEQINLTKEYCKTQFVSKGMIADVAIHDKGDGNPHAHVLLTMRGLDENGRWLPKCRKEYVLDENGNRIRMESGEWKSRRVNTVDWNRQCHAETWRHEWEVAQNAALEKASRPERVSLKSFERQGIAYAPQVHLGPAASAMERKGIRTDFGNLNKEIRFVNRELYSLTRSIKNLQDLITTYVNAISELDMLDNPEEQSLSKVLSLYAEKRKQERSTWSNGADQKGTAGDLKRMASFFVFARQNAIYTVKDLSDYLDRMLQETTGIRNRIRGNERRVSEIDLILKADETVVSLKSLHDEYLRIGWKSKKEKFMENHPELKEYGRAMRTLKKLSPDGKPNRQKLETEKTALQEDNTKLTEELSALLRDLDQAKTARLFIREILPDAIPSKTDGKTSVREALKDNRKKSERIDELTGQFSGQKTARVTERS